MLVAIQYPFHILSVDEIGIPILKLDSQNMIGQSVLKILGQKSDQAMFVSIILDVENRGSARSQFIVYDQSGQERRAIVSFCPFLQANGGLCCQVTIEPSEAITLDDGFDDSNCPYALLAAESPHCVMLVNDDFLTKFRCTRAQAVGAAFARFQGPDQSSWNPLLDAALRGKIVRDRVHTSPSLPLALDDAICVPVVGALNGVIRYILVLFSPCSAICRPLASRPNPHHRLSTATIWPPCSLSFAPDNSSSRPESHRALRKQHAQGGRSLEEVSRLGPERAESPPRPDSDGPPAIVIPRRGFEPVRSPAVVVTPALLGTLKGLPLPRAAAAIGLSTTAFKQACRKLGIARWDFRRGAGRANDCAPEHPRPIGRAKQGGPALAAGGARHLDAGATPPLLPPLPPLIGAPAPPPRLPPLLSLGFPALEDGRRCRVARPRSLLPPKAPEGPGPGLKWPHCPDAPTPEDLGRNQIFRLLSQ